MWKLELTSGWAEMVLPNRYRVPDVMGAHTELVHRPSHSHLIDQTNSSCRREVGPTHRTCGVKGGYFVFLGHLSMFHCWVKSSI